MDSEGKQYDSSLSTDREASATSDLSYYFEVDTLQQIRYKNMLSYKPEWKQYQFQLHQQQ